MMLLTTDTVSSILDLRSKYGDVGRLVQPRMCSTLGLMVETGMPWAADNDAFNGFESGPWLTMLGKLAGLPNCLFVVAPDRVADARETLTLFTRYAPVIRDCGLPVAYVLQDGLPSVGVPWDLTDAIFIGGSTEFKMGSHAARAAKEAKARGKWLHMGRVNTLRRIEYAQSLGCDSIDGTKWTMYTATYEHQLRALSHAQGGLGMG